MEVCILILAIIVGILIGVMIFILHEFNGISKDVNALYDSVSNLTKKHDSLSVGANMTYDELNKVHLDIARLNDHIDSLENHTHSYEFNDGILYIKEPIIN